MIDTNIPPTTAMSSPGQELPADALSSGSGADSTVLAKPIPGKAVVTSVPISRIAFPFNFNGPSSRRKPSTSPPASSPPHRGFSPVPSPLGRQGESQTPPQRRSPVSRIAAYRAQHRHHGYSRQALLHAKWFWSTKEGEWHDHGSAKSVASVGSREPSAGLRTFNQLHKPRHCSRGVRPPAFEGDDEGRPTSPAATSFPRRGDITALRDPYCVEADRCFAHVPVWTLAKVLWVHDMHALSLPKVETPATDVDDDPFDEVASVSSFETNTSVGFSDDSDSTLVDSETEWETSCSKGRETSSSLAGPSSLSQTNSPLAWTKDVYLKPPRSLSCSRPVNWYRRWEILLELSHSKKRPEKSPPMVLKPLPMHIKVAPPPKRYSFTRGFLTGLKKSPRPPTPSTSSFVVQDSFINPSHPAAG